MRVISSSSSGIYFIYCEGNFWYCMDVYISYEQIMLVPLEYNLFFLDFIIFWHHVDVCDFFEQMMSYLMNTIWSF